MRIPNEVHSAESWLINGIAHDLDLLDVWALPAQGTRTDFDALLSVMGSLDPTEAGTATKALVWARLRLGALFGWDVPTGELPIPGESETTLGERLPSELRGSADSTPLSELFQVAGLVPLYRTDDEWAGEISNATVHGVLHLAWVDHGSGRYQGRLSIYVKPRGLAGAVYMKLIQPFRHLVVYPAVMRQIELAWKNRTGTRSG